MPQREYFLIKEKYLIQESWRGEILLPLNINDIFVREIEVFSISAMTLRGLHFQAPPFAQSKLVYCSQGSIFYVALDIRLGSPTFGKWWGDILSSENRYQSYIPAGFADGFVTLEPESVVVQRCSSYFNPELQGGVRWDSCGIDWPLQGLPVLSHEETSAPALSDLFSPFVYGENS